MKQDAYCWWKKSHQLGWKKTIKNLVNNGINYLSTGAGFLPSTVGWPSGQKISMTSRQISACRRPNSSLGVKPQLRWPSNFETEKKKKRKKNHVKGSSISKQQQQQNTHQFFLSDWNFFNFINFNSHQPNIFCCIFFRVRGTSSFTKLGSSTPFITADLIFGHVSSVQGDDLLLWFFRETQEVLILTEKRIINLKKITHIPLLCKLPPICTCSKKCI